MDLYRELSAETRSLSKAEAQMMLELVDAWRTLEHRKHLAVELSNVKPAAMRLERQPSNVRRAIGGF